MSCGAISGANGIGALCAPSGAEPTDTSETIELLPHPAFGRLGESQDAGAQLAALLLESGWQDKQIARTIRNSQEKAQEAAENAQLHAMREKAEERYAAGMIGGVAGCVSGTLTMASGSVMASGGDAKPTAAIQGKADQLKGVGQYTEALGKLGSTSATRQADLADEEATRQEQIAGRRKRGVEDASDANDDAKKLIDRALDFYKEYQTAKNDSMRASLLKA